MKKLLCLAVPWLLLALTGCGTYHGAVYSEYSQFALDIRTSAESSSPIKVDLGYDRGVMTYTPKLKGETGEACSVISWQDIGSVVTPSMVSTSSVLRVNSGFISGTAATVAAVPSDTHVTIAPDPETKSPTVQLTTVGTPGERISTALTGKKFGQDGNTLKIRQWLRADTQNPGKLNQWITDQKLNPDPNKPAIGIGNILNDEDGAKQRQEIVDQFIIN